MAIATRTNGDARERLDATRAEAAQAWKAFADERDRLNEQEAEPTTEEVTDLDELHETYEEKAEAMGAAETAWLASLGSTKTGLVRHKGSTVSRTVADAITDVLDAKALVSPAGAVLAPDVLDLIVSRARRPHSILALLTQMQTDGSRIDSVLERIKLQPDHAHALRECMRSLRRGGTLLIAGVYGGPVHMFPLGDLFDMQVTLRMGQANVRRWTDELLPLLADGDPLGVDDLVTHRMSLEEAPNAYRLFQRKEDGCIKVVLEPNR